VNRRAFLEEMGSLIGLATGGAVLAGCATHRGVRFDDPYGPDVDQYLASLDEQVDRIRNHPTDPELARNLRAEGLPHDFLQRSIAAMLVAGAFRDLPEAAQRHPAMQERVAREASNMGQTVLGMAAFLDRLPRERRRGIRKTLREEPELFATLRAGVSRAGSEHGVDPERRAQFDAALDDVVWRLSRQDPGLLLDDVVEGVDHHARANLLSRAEWGEVLGDDDDPVPDPIPLAGEAYSYESRSRRTARTGLRTMGIGGIILGVAGVSALLGAALMGPAEGLGTGLVVVGVIGGTVGVIVLLVGLIILLVSAFQRGSERRAEEEGWEEEEYTPAPRPENE